MSTENIEMTQDEGVAKRTRRFRTKAERFQEHATKLEARAFDAITDLKALCSEQYSEADVVPYIDRIQGRLNLMREKLLANALPGSGE